MTIDIITKAGVQVGISITPMELESSSCLMDLIKNLIGGATTGTIPRTEVKPAAVPAKEEKKAKNADEEKKPPVDHGKICALWRSARWTVKDIAEDVGCSQQTVVNHLKSEGLWKTDKA